MAKSADPSSFLTLQMATVDDEAMEQLSQRLLSENCSITALDLSYNAALGKEGLAALARGLSQNTTVSALNLAGCKGITDRAAADFARTLRVDGKGTCKLSKVNFSGCHLGDQFAKQVGACLEPSYPPAGDVLLGSVNLSGCESLTDEGLVAMVKPLAASPSLNSLDLHGCILLTDSGFAQLAKRLRYNISLEYLDLSWCELLSDLTAQRLAEALEENRALKTLRLACCVALTNDGAISLATALQTNRTLTALDLDSVPGLGRPTMLAFHGLLHDTNRTLTKLKLDGGTAATAQLGGAAAAGAAAKEPNAMGEGGAARGAARGASTRAVGTGRDSRAKEPHPTRSPPDSREKAHPARSQATCHRMGEQENGAPVGWYAQQIEKMLLRNSQAHDSAQRDQLTSQLASRRYSTVKSFDLLRLLQSTISSGATMYNDDNADGCLRLFLTTAQLVVSSGVEGSASIAAALSAVQSKMQADAAEERAGRGPTSTMQHKLWALRAAFDELLETLRDSDADCAADHTMALRRTRSLVSGSGSSSGPTTPKALPGKEAYRQATVNLSAHRPRASA